MSEAVTAGLDFRVSDASGQRSYTIKGFSPGASVRDLIKVLIPKMGLNTQDSNGRPLDYQAFSKTESVHLRGTDRVGDVLKQGEEVSILPDIAAG